MLLLDVALIILTLYKCVLSFAVAGRRFSEQHVASSLFALLHQEVPFCKETACLLQKQMGEWHLDDWDLTAIKASLQAGGITCSSDCLSCVGIPL